MKMFGHNMRRMLLASAAATLAASAGAARAQELAAEADEIIVTAQKRAENVQDVPASVSVVGAARLESFHSTQLTDIAASVAGVQIDSGGTPGQTIISLRGVAPIGPGQTVGTYLDDTPVGSSSLYTRAGEFTLDLLPYDIDRIEVLRGPQGTLYGASSIGGLLKYATKPVDLEDFGARAGADLFDVAHGGGTGWAARGAVNVPLVAGKLGLTASYGYQHTPGYIDNIVTGEKDQNDFSQQAGRVALRWEATPDISVRLSAIYQKIDSDDNATTLLFDTPAQDAVAGYANNNLVDQPFRKEFQYYSATADWNLGFATLTSATSYSETETTQVQDGSGDFAVLFPIFGAEVGKSPFRLDLDLTKWTQEVRLTSPTGGTLEWLIGGFYTHEKSNNEQTARAQTMDGAPIPGIDPFAVVRLPSTYEEYAAFGNVTLRLSDWFDVSLGLRYAHNAQDYTQISFGPLFQLLGGDQLNPGDSSESVFTYSVSPRFHLSEDVMVYGRVATGYRPGGPNAILTGFEKPEVSSDRLTNFEIGLKSEFLDRRALINVALFYMDWKDIQITVLCPGVSGCSYLDNAGTASSQGVELTMALRPTAGLSVGFNAAYTDAKLTDDAPTVFGVDGDVLPRIPKWSASVTAEYSAPLAGDWIAGVGGAVRFVDDRVTAFSLSPTRRRIEGHTAVDANASVSNERLTFRLFAKNLFDSKGLQSVIPNSDISGTPYLAGTRLQPRTVGLAADIRF